MKSALEKIFELEKQLNDFEQKHGDLQEELLLTKRKTNSYQKKISSKCAALKIVSAIFYEIFIFSRNDSPSKTMKNVFYFI